jgi:hypothetical protein
MCKIVKIFIKTKKSQKLAERYTTLKQNPISGPYCKLVNYENSDEENESKKAEQQKSPR